MLFQISTYQDLLTTFDIALGIIFVVCFIGNLSPLPTPYLLVVWIVATKFSAGNIGIPLICGLIGSFGSLLGEFMTYWIGRITHRILSPQKISQMQYLIDILEHRRGLIPLIVYFFGATPLSDDIILMPLGLLRYSQKKALFFCWLGKFTLLTILALLPDLLNATSSEYQFITTMLPLYGILGLMYVLLKVDWIEFVKSKKWLQKLLKMDIS